MEEKTQFSPHQYRPTENIYRPGFVMMSMRANIDVKCRSVFWSRFLTLLVAQSQSSCCGSRKSLQATCPGRFCVVGMSLSLGFQCQFTIHGSPPKGRDFVQSAPLGCSNPLERIVAHRGKQGVFTGRYVQCLISRAGNLNPSHRKVCLTSRLFFAEDGIFRDPAQDLSALSAGRRAAPSFVNMYSTLGGTSGYTLR